jgi:membrane protease YdiL (CAAX protease family)
VLVVALVVAFGLSSLLPGWAGLPVGAVVLIVVVRMTSASLGWVSTSLDHRSVAVGLAFAALSAGGIYVWWLTLPPLYLPGIVPAWLPPALVIPLCIGLAALNSVFEEVVWRGLLARALEPVLGWKGSTLLLAALFGLAHVDAIPSGALGVALTFGFALAAPVIVRWRSGSLAIVIVAHFAADLTGLLLLTGGGG